MNAGRARGRSTYTDPRSSAFAGSISILWQGGSHARDRSILDAFTRCGVCTRRERSAQELVGEGEKAGTKIVVRGLKRDEGGTVTLRFQVVNDGNTSQPMYQLIGNSLDGHAHLIDAANKKKYLVVKDSPASASAPRSGTTWTRAARSTCGSSSRRRPRACRRSPSSSTASSRSNPFRSLRAEEAES